MGAVRDAQRDGAQGAHRREDLPGVREGVGRVRAADRGRRGRGAVLPQRRRGGYQRGGYQREDPREALLPAGSAGAVPGVAGRGYAAGAAVRVGRRRGHRRAALCGGLTGRRGGLGGVGAVRDQRVDRGAHRRAGSVGEPRGGVPDAGRRCGRAAGHGPVRGQGAGVVAGGARDERGLGGGRGRQRGARERRGRRARTSGGGPVRGRGGSRGGSAGAEAGARERGSRRPRPRPRLANHRRRRS